VGRAWASDSILRGEPVDNPPVKVFKEVKPREHIPSGFQFPPPNILDDPLNEPPAYSNFVGFSVKKVLDKGRLICYCGDDSRRVFLGFHSL